MVFRYATRMYLKLISEKEMGIEGGAEIMRTEKPAAGAHIPGPAPLPAVKVRGWRKALYLAAAGLFFLLAVLGAFLPVLPTTPFLLLTSFFLVRSSPQLHKKLLASRVFGGLLRDWHKSRGVRPHVKITAVTVMTGVVGISIFSGKLSPILLGLLFVLAGIGLFVVLKLPTIRD